MAPLLFSIALAACGAGEESPLSVASSTRAATATYNFWNERAGSTGTLIINHKGELGQSLVTIIATFDSPDDSLRVDLKREIEAVIEDGRGAQLQSATVPVTGGLTQLWLPDPPPPPPGSYWSRYLTVTLVEQYSYRAFPWAPVGPFRRKRMLPRLPGHESTFPVAY
jgi:hypothetical protein